MNTLDTSILTGLPVPTVTEIADHVGVLHTSTRSGPEGEVVADLLGEHDHVLLSSDAFPSEAEATAQVAKIVEACVAWQGANLPVARADASFSC